MLQGSVLFDALVSAFGKKKKERKKREKHLEGIFPRVYMPQCLCHTGISLAIRCN
jgi:hypothetical protein